MSFFLRFFFRFRLDSLLFRGIEGLCLLHLIGKSICIWSLLFLHLMCTQLSHVQLLLCISAIDQNVLWSEYG